MPQPCVSIIIPVYNGAKTIIESLDSLLKQDYIEKNSTSVEIIIINDNSTDNTLSLISRYSWIYFLPFFDLMYLIIYFFINLLFSR